MLLRLPGLDWLEIGSGYLNAVYRGTVRGGLNPDTADVFRQATVSHVVGLCGREHLLSCLL